jgi:hypothetical protein
VLISGAATLRQGGKKPMMPGTVADIVIWLQWRNGCNCCDMTPKIWNQVSRMKITTKMRVNVGTNKNLTMGHEIKNDCAGEGQQKFAWPEQSQDSSAYTEMSTSLLVEEVAPFPWNKKIIGHWSRRVPKPRMTVLARARNKLP